VTGIDSPVNIDSSTEETPFITIPIEKKIETISFQVVEK
jgi:hypothetical protein